MGKILMLLISLFLIISCTTTDKITTIISLDDVEQKLIKANLIFFSTNFFDSNIDRFNKVNNLTIEKMNDKMNLIGVSEGAPRSGIYRNSKILNNNAIVLKFKPSNTTSMSISIYSDLNDKNKLIYDFGVVFSNGDTIKLYNIKNGKIEYIPLNKNRYNPDEDYIIIFERDGKGYITTYIFNSEGKYISHRFNEQVSNIPFSVLITVGKGSIEFNKYYEIELE
jgi:hypothetical protein